MILQSKIKIKLLLLKNNQINLGLMIGNDFNIYI